MRFLKLKWLNYFLLLTLVNVTLHICYLYFLLQAHDSLDHTANNIYSFEQALFRWAQFVKAHDGLFPGIIVV